MLADVLGKRVSVLENQEGSAFGAALLGLNHQVGEVRPSRILRKFLDKASCFFKVSKGLRFSCGRAAEQPRDSAESRAARPSAASAY